MKKIFCIIFSISLFTITGNAQVKRETNPSQNVAANSDEKSQKLEMMKSLNLSKEQMGQLKEFRRSMKQKKDDITNNSSLSEQQKQDQLRELHKEQKEKMNSILTPEQMEKLKQERTNAKMEKKGNMNQTDSTSEMMKN